VDAFRGLLALLVVAVAAVLIVVLYRDLARDKREDTMFVPARRRRRALLTAALFTVLFPAVGARRGTAGVLIGLGLAAAIWIETAIRVRRLRD
jgi:hypothetical protein